MESNKQNDTSDIEKTVSLILRDGNENNIAEGVRVSQALYNTLGEISTSFLVKENPQAFQMLFLDAFQSIFAGKGVKRGNDIIPFSTGGFFDPMNLFRNFPHREKIVLARSLAALSSYTTKNACGGPDARIEVELKSATAKKRDGNLNVYYLRRMR